MALKFIFCAPPTLFLICLGFPAAARANVADAPAENAGQGPKKLTLAEVKQNAFERNWDLLAARSGVDLATAQQIVAREFPNPTLSLTAAKIGTHDNATALGNGVWNRSYDSIAAVNQLIEIAGKRSSRQASARAGVQGARARFYDAKRTLDQGVTKAYAATLLAEDNVRILRASAQSLRKEAEIAGVRFKAGDISASDEKQIENNADVFELQANSAEAAAVQARIAVELLMGVDQPKGNWAPADSLEKLMIAPPEENASKPEAARSDVLAAEADLRKSKADLRLQKAIRIPDPTLLVEYEHNVNQPSPPPAPDTLGLGVSFPLPLWNRNGGAIKAAQAARDQAAIQLEKVKAQVISDIAVAESAYREALERLQRYQKQIQPKSAQVREAIAFSYQKGGASLVDLLTAERDDNNVRLAAVQAMSDTASAAADLAAARQVLSETELIPRK
ncbi:MAG TPA: TolC family protein [Verrucomicrobiae bacterium]|nr:TolC family protein [Verrucomicrobiae bacterium]